MKLVIIQFHSKMHGPYDITHHLNRRSLCQVQSENLSACEEEIRLELNVRSIYLQYYLQ
jgi:hypothetical protein